MAFAQSESEAEAALSLARRVLEGELGIALHPEKTRVVSVAHGFEFLGFHYFRDPKSGRFIKEVRRKSVARFRDSVRQRTPRLRTERRVKPKNITLSRLRKNQRLGAIIADLNRFQAGWHWYFKQLWSWRPRLPFCSYDDFVRRRVRLAIVGRVGNGWWNQRITNAMLRELGLVPLNELHNRYQQGRLRAPVRQD